MNFDRHVNAHFEMFNHLVKGDGDSAEKHRDFYDEYLAVMDLDAAYYMQTVETVFVRHALPKGEMTHRGQRVDLKAIRNCGLMTVEGEKDDISGVGQTHAAQELCVNIPAAKKLHHLQTRGRPLRRVQRFALPQADRAAHPRSSSPRSTKRRRSRTAGEPRALHWRQSRLRRRRTLLGAIFSSTSLRGGPLITAIDVARAGLRGQVEPAPGINEDGLQWAAGRRRVSCVAVVCAGRRPPRPDDGSIFPSTIPPARSSSARPAENSTSSWTPTPPSPIPWRSPSAARNGAAPPTFTANMSSPPGRRRTWSGATIPSLPDLIAGGSPHNPMGARAITLDRDEIAIHGTTRAMRASIGKAASYGCIRMLNEDVIDLFDRVSVGAQVMIAP